MKSREIESKEEKEWEKLGEKELENLWNNEKDEEEWKKYL